MARWKDLITGTWKGSDSVSVRVWGSVYISPQDAETPVWVPERCVPPVITMDPDPGEDLLGIREEPTDTHASAFLSTSVSLGMAVIEVDEEQANVTGIFGLSESLCFTLVKNVSLLSNNSSIFLCGLEWY